MKKITCLLLMLTLSACASSRGFDRAGMRGQIIDQDAVSGENPQKATAQRPQLPSQFKLAIFFAPPENDRESVNLRVWLDENRDVLQNISTELKKRKNLSDVFVINDPSLENADNEDIRLAAARAGADAVLIINSTFDIDRYNNFLSYSYFLIITPLIVMGTEADALYMVNASLWDVREQYCYMSAEAEGTAKQTRPAFFIRENDVVREAKSGALAALTKELSKQLVNLSSNDR